MINAGNKTLGGLFTTYLLLILNTFTSQENAQNYERGHSVIRFAIMGRGGGVIQLGGASKYQNRINANKGEEGLNFGNFLITIIECPQIGNV